MKKIFFYITLALMVTNLFSCKDEDDTQISGEGGKLTGIWLAEEADETYNAIQITEDGRIERVWLEGESVERATGHADAIITEIDDSSLDLFAVKGEGTAKYKLSTTVTFYEGKFVGCNRLYLSSDDIEGLEEGAYYLQLPALNPGMESIEVERDEDLMGEWVQSFGDNSYEFSESSIVVNGYSYKDWYTSDGMLYLSTNVGDLEFYLEIPYRIEEGALDMDGTTYIRPSDKVVGEPGDLEGVWMKCNSSYLYYVDNSLYYGMKVDADGNLTNPRFSTSLSLDNSKVKKEMIITSASDGKFTAETKSGSTKGTYSVDTVVFFSQNAKKYVKMVHLQILSSGYSYNLAGDNNSATSLVGHYLKVIEPDGSYCDISSVASNLIGTWSLDFYSETESGTQYFIFNQDGTMCIRSKYDDGKVTNDYYYYGPAFLSSVLSELYIRPTNNTTDAYENTFEWFISGTTLYIRFKGESHWFFYEKQ